MLGLFGGTFDPVHFGHLRLAQEVGEALGLDSVRLLPAGRPPHRGRPSVTPLQRLEMVRLAAEGNPLLEVDDREVFKTEPSYTVTTLETIRLESGNTPLCLLMGADAFLSLTTWHRWKELFELSHIVVAYRPGFALDAHGAGMVPELRQQWLARMRQDIDELRAAPAGGIFAQPITPLDISASQIRGLLRSGRSPRYLLPARVLDYIQTHHLYSQEQDGP